VDTLGHITRNSVLQWGEMPTSVGMLKFTFRALILTRTYSTFGDRAFGAAGPGLWNSLPSHLKEADISYSEFRRSLKTFLVGQWGHGAV